MTALDLDGDLLAVLRERAAEQGLQVATITADAADFAAEHASI